LRGGCFHIDIVKWEYKAVQAASLEDADEPFVKRYAARLPHRQNRDQTVCVRCLFFSPFYTAKTTDTGRTLNPKGEWDKIFAETSEYPTVSPKSFHAAQR